MTDTPSTTPRSTDSTEDSTQTLAETPNGADAGAMLDRVVQGAHDGIDQLAEAAAPHLQRLEEGLSAASDSLREETAKARELGDEWLESLRCSVRQNPLAAIAAAAALGLLLARLSR